MALAAGTRLGPYEVLGLLGEGGMGAVYRARDPRLGREVLAHRAPSPRQVLTLAHQAAQGLAAAHAKGIVHRDLKPENLFLTTDGRVKILDFGLAVETPRAAADGATTLAPTRLTALEGTLAYLAPEQVQGEPADPRTDVFAFGVVLYELLTGQHPFRRETATATLAAILQDTPPPLETTDRAIPAATELVVRRCLQKHREDLYADGQALVPALEEARHAPASATLQDLEERNPYPGLRAFTEQDAPVFFGREDEVTALWARLRTRPLLAVIGPSGAGKTSFLRAGVLPARPEGWAVIACTPGTAPLRALGQALAPELGHDVEALRQLVAFDDPEVAFTLLRRWRHAHAQALVVVDQFEELFTLNPPDVQARVAALLGRLATEADVHVALSLRDDFLMRCHDHPALAPVFFELTPLGPLTREGLRRAVVEPATKRGYRFEDEALVDEMVESVEGARAALPLLAFAVARLWELRDREAHVLTRAAYEQIGGVAGALAQHAEATLDRIGSMQQDLVRELFRNLVTAQGTRAVIDREELLSAFPERAAAETVLRMLVDARLLTEYEVDGPPGESARALVEIAHESLLKAWPRLVRWQAQDEDGAQLRDQLKQAAHLWAEKGRTPDLLWTGTAVQEYALWRQRYPGALTAIEEAFAHAMADKARRSRQIRRLATGAVVVAALLVAAVTGALWWRSEIARTQAQAEARRAEASKLLALAELRLADDPTEALALATASLGQADTPEARVFATKVLWDSPPAFEIVGSTDQPRVPAFSLDGRWLAAAGHTTDVRVWSHDGRGPLVLPGHEISGGGPNVARWASNDLLVTGLAPGLAKRVHVWALPKGERLRTIDFRAFDWQVGPGRLLAEINQWNSEDRRLLRSWSLPNGEPVDVGVGEWAKLKSTDSFFEPGGSAWLYSRGLEIHAHPLPEGSGPDRLFARLGADVARLDLDKPGRIVVVDRAGQLYVWHAPPGPEAEPRVFQSSGLPVARLDSSERWLYAVDAAEQKLRIRDVSAWPDARPLQLRRGASWWLSAADVHPSGDWAVASTSRFTRLTFWPLPRQAPVIVDGYQIFQRPVVFSPDSRWLATTWADGRIRLWPLPGSGTSAVRTPELPPGQQWLPVMFDRGGRFLLVTAAFLRASAAVPLDGTPARTVPAGARAISPSGRLVAGAFLMEAAGGQKERTLWVSDVEAGATRHFPLPACEPSQDRAIGSPEMAKAYGGGVSHLAFANESTIYTVGIGGLRRWNIETGAHEALTAGPPGSGLLASFSEEARTALLTHQREGDPLRCQQVLVYDTRAGTSRQPPPWAVCDEVQVVRSAGVGGANAVIDGSGKVAAFSSPDGSVRVGRIDGAAPHLLVGHKGPVQFMAISPDLRWMATSGEDNTLRLWPLPDFSKPPLHALPLDQLLAKLRSLTNFRAVRDPASPTGWKIDIGPFPGWKEVPTW